MRKADRLQQFQTGDAGSAGAVADELGGLHVAAGEMQRVDQAGGGDDGGAMLIVMEDRDVEQFAQPLLDDETLRRLDVFQIDAAPALAEQLDAIDEFVRVFGRNFEVDRIDVGKALEQHRLAFHDRLGRQRAEIAETENGGAVGDDGDEIALGRVVVGTAFIFGDGQHRDRDARRIGQRQVALGRHRLGGNDLELPGATLGMKQKCFLIGEVWPFGTARRRGGHYNSLDSEQFLGGSRLAGR